MGRNFLGGTDSSLYEAAADATPQGTNITVFAIINPDIPGTGFQMIVGRDESSAADRVYQFRVNDTQKLEFIVFVGGVNKHAISAGNISAAEHRVMATIDASNADVYIDSSSSDGNVNPGGNLDADVVGITIGAQCTDNDGTNIVSQYNGLIAECAEWNRILIAGERAGLLSGRYSPDHYPRGLLWYAKLIGNNDPEIDAVGGNLFDLKGGGGAPTKAAHPPMIYPARTHIGVPTVAPPSGFFLPVIGSEAIGSAVFGQLIVR